MGVDRLLKLIGNGYSKGDGGWGDHNHVEQDRQTQMNLDRFPLGKVLTVSTQLGKEPHEICVRTFLHGFFDCGSHSRWIAILRDILVATLLNPCQTIDSRDHTVAPASLQVNMNPRRNHRLRDWAHLIVHNTFVWRMFVSVNAQKGSTEVSAPISAF